MHACGEAFGLTADAALVVEDDGAAVAALPLFERRRGPFRALVVPPLVPVVSPLLGGPPAEAEVHRRASPLDALLAAVEAKYDRATLLPHPSLGDVRPLTWAGWSVRPRYTYLLDLRGEDDLQRRWSGGTRRAAAKAADVYRFEEDARFAGHAVALMEASYARQAEPLGLDGRAVRALADRLVGAGFARAFAVRPQAEAAPEAAVVVAHDRRTAHYWIAGSRPGPAMTVLLAHLLPRLRADGIETFDFLGANTPSIAEFKRRFGPALQPYTLARRDVHPALRLLHRISGRG